MMLNNKVSYMSKGDIKKVIKMHSLTIKTDYLKNMPYKIDEHCFYVDVEYITYPVLNVESVYYTNICLQASHCSVSNFPFILRHDILLHVCHVSQSIASGVGTLVVLKLQPF